ncbi:Uncharacterised protein [Klebsiella pneumoniae]|uniref:Uncharacterized protein n=1 Tax=Klebsiella pneumoniae TaxID=573 RepID=A0A378F953_KLEPN|nr:Uncharacterised protein [Klebsiella pneumoniae]
MKMPPNARPTSPRFPARWPDDRRHLIQNTLQACEEYHDVEEA